MPPVPKLRVLDSQQAAKRTKPKKNRDMGRRAIRREPQPSSSRRPKAEALGIVLLFGALLTGAMLAGWHPIGSAQASPGAAGGAFANGLMAWLGITAFLLPPLFLIGGLRLLQSKVLGLRGRAAGAALVLWVVAAGLFEVIDRAGGNLLAPELSRLGGLLGALVASPFLALLSPGLASLVLLAVFGSVAVYAFGKELKNLVVLLDLGERFLAWFGIQVLRVLVGGVNLLLAVGPSLARAGQAFVRAGQAIRSFFLGAYDRIRDSFDAPNESAEGTTPAWAPPPVWKTSRAPSEDDPSADQDEEPEDSTVSALHQPIPSLRSESYDVVLPPVPPIVHTRSLSQRAVPDPHARPLSAYDEMDEDEPLDLEEDEFDFSIHGVGPERSLVALSDAAPDLLESQTRKTALPDPEPVVATQTRKTALPDPEPVVVASSRKPALPDPEPVVVAPPVPQPEIVPEIRPRQTSSIDVRPRQLPEPASESRQSLEIAPPEPSFKPASILAQFTDVPKPAEPPTKAVPSFLQPGLRELPVEPIQIPARLVPPAPAPQAPAPAPAFLSQPPAAEASSDAVPWASEPSSDSVPWASEALASRSAEPARTPEPVVLPRVAVREFMPPPAVASRVKPRTPVRPPEPEVLSDEEAIEASLNEASDLFTVGPLGEPEEDDEDTGPTLDESPLDETSPDEDAPPAEEIPPAYAPAGFSYLMPPLELLEDPPPQQAQVLEDELRENSRLLLAKLGDFGVQGAITCIRPGPVITRYELEPAPGIKINKIIGLADDLALALKAVAAPRVAPIPKSSALGIELPNHNRETVHFKSIVESPAYEQNPSPLKMALGVDIAGNPYIADLARMPHLLIAGSTGSGKSVCVNTLLLSLLMNANPEQVQLLLIDPKMLEMSIYNDIPHLLEEVVTEPKKAATALGWAVREMENRYKKLSRRKVRNISQYNEVVEREPIAAPTRRDPKPEMEFPLPYIVIIIDELADLMMVSGNEVETAITRLAQMARAAGIHLILATQRPSVDVITGSIKANFPCRISFKVASKVDSRTVLDGNGAEKLLGRGDMFFIAPGTSSAMRIHGCFLSEEDILRVVEHWKPQPPVKKRSASIFEEEAAGKAAEEQDFAKQDELYEPAVRFIVESGHASISLLQRRLRVGHARAARLIDMMEQDGVVGGFEGSKTREVLWKPDQLPENYGV